MADYASGRNGGGGHLSGSKPLNAGARPSMLPRQSLAPGTANSRSGNAPRSSLAPIGFGGQGLSVSRAGDEMGVVATPHARQSTMSRASVGRPSMAPTPNNGRYSNAAIETVMSGLMLAIAKKPPRQLTDTRPLRTKSFMEKMERDIVALLHDTHFIFPARHQGGLHEPTQALFLQVFRHLYLFLDPNHKFVQEPKKESEEMLQCLTDFRYPFLGDLSKTKLSAAGSAQNWPPVCGMLHWMANLVKMLVMVPSRTKYQGGPLERQIEPEDDAGHFYQFLWKCYEKFWANEDEYPEEKLALEQAFAERNNVLRQELAELKEEEKQYRERLETLKSDDALEVEKFEERILKEDLLKFRTYRDEKLNPKIEKTRKALEKLKEALANSEATYREKEKEKAELQQRLSLQPVSEDQYRGMMRRREELKKQIDEVAKKMREAMKANYNKEVVLTNKQAVTEEVLEDLTNKAKEAGFFPLVLETGARLYTIDVNPHNESTMLAEGLNLDRDIDLRIKNEKKEQAQKLMSLRQKKGKQAEQLDSLIDELDSLKDQVTDLSIKHDNIQARIEETKKAIEEERDAFVRESRDLHDMLEEMDRSSRDNVERTQAELEVARAILTKFEQRAAAYREKLGQEISRGCEIALRPRVVVTEGLEELEEIVKQHCSLP